MADALTERLPPNAIAMEEALLGSILIAYSAMQAEIMDYLIEVVKLPPKAFFMLAHEYMFDALADMYQHKIAIDHLTLEAELIKRGHFDEIGGMSYIYRLVSLQPDFYHAATYATAVMEAYLRRKAIFAGTEIANLANDLALSMPKLLRRSAALIEDLTPNARPNTTATMTDAFMELIEQSDNRRAGEIMPAVRTEINGMDSLMIDGGFTAGQFITIFARSGHCKTVTMAEIARNAACAGQHVLYFSLEMPKADIVARVVAALTGIPTRQIRSGRMSDADWSTYQKALGTVSNWNLVWDDESTLTIRDIQTRARAENKLGHLDLVIVDYVQLIDVSEHKNRIDAWDDIARLLKSLAKELQCVVICGAQANRGANAREDKRPQVSDVRGSAAFEHSSDALIGLLYPVKDDPNVEHPEYLEWFAVKNRHGECGHGKVIFNAATSRITNIQTRPDYGQR